MRLLASVLAAGLAMATPAAAQPPVRPPVPEPAARFAGAVQQARTVMMTDPRRALAIADQAGVLAGAIRDPRAATLAGARAAWLRGEALARLEDPGAGAALETALRGVLRAAPADPLHGDVLLSRGWVREAAGQIAAGLNDFQQSFVLFRAAGDARGAAKALGNIAGIYQDAGDLDRAQRYYAQAAEMYRGDPAFALAAYNNVAGVSRARGQYALAEQQYQRALDAARGAASPRLEASVLTNLAATRVDRGDLAGGERLAWAALRLADSAAAADERPFAWGVLARVAAARGDAPRAAKLIDRTFEGIDLAHSTLPFRDFHRLAADVYARVGRDGPALAHMRAWKRLDDDARAVAVTTNAALMAARFDFSTQNLRIVQLQANRARLHETMLIGAVAATGLVASLLLLGILGLRRSRNQTRDANRQLSKALEAKTEFLAMTSHEIRTPLNGILGMTQVMLADAGLPPPARGRIEIIHGAGETMRALVDDILDLSKMDTGNLVLDQGPVRARALIEEIAALWRDRAVAKGLTLSVEVSACPTLIESDTARLRQVIGNLLSNAVKFTERGGVVVRAAAEGDRLTISVADTGIGVAPEHHELIFEKFQQADGSTSRRFGGTGLGLAICRSIATAMEGEVTIVSEAGAGATFTLSVPLRLLEAPAEAAAPPARSVLLLEANPLSQRVMAKALAAGGFAACPVATLDELLARLPAGTAKAVVAKAADLGDRDAELVAAASAAGARAVLIVEADAPVPAGADAGKALILRKPVSTATLLAAVAAEHDLPAAA